MNKKMYNTNMKLEKIDYKIINFLKKITVPSARIALFIIFFYFGFLKLIGLSPASELVYSLFNQTINFMDFTIFYILFSLFECLIGILFLIKGAERIVFPLLLFHIVTTTLPLFILPEAIWQQKFIPTLEGQYIIKNIVIIAAAIGLVSHIHPLSEKN